jgi:hypothetical protein
MNTIFHVTGKTNFVNFVGLWFSNRVERVYAPGEDITSIIGLPAVVLGDHAHLDDLSLLAKASLRSRKQIKDPKVRIVQIALGEKKRKSKHADAVFNIACSGNPGDANINLLLSLEGIWRQERGGNGHERKSIAVPK